MTTKRAFCKISCFQILNNKLKKYLRFHHRNSVPHRNSAPRANPYTNLIGPGPEMK